MAKLNARGRKCLVEVSREYTAEVLQAATDARIRRDYPDGQWTRSDGTVEPLPASMAQALTTWERLTRRLMSDGTVLEKRDVRFQPDWLDKQGRRYSYGWKVYGTLKAGLTAADFARIYAAPRKSGAPSPWTVAQGAQGAPATVISRTRILRAVQSGESVGFCTSCGAEASGVEPDATGYRCESCGQHAVTGAETLLSEVA